MATAKIEIVRPLPNFSPSLWGDLCPPVTIDNQVLTHIKEAGYNAIQLIGFDEHKDYFTVGYRMVPEEAGHDSLESEDAVKITVESSRYEENAAGFQQVDRVFGCRVHGDNADSGYNVMVNANDPRVADSLVAEEQNMSKENSTCEKPLDGCGGGNLAEDIANCIDGGRNIEEDGMNKDKVQVYRRLVTKECKEINFMDSMLEIEEGSDSNVVKNKSTPCIDSTETPKKISGVEKTDRLQIAEST